MTNRRLWHIPVGALAALVLVGGLGWAMMTSARPPDSIIAVEHELGQPLLAYSPGGNQPHVVFAFGNAVRFDALELDWLSIHWPPEPRWQWSGHWTSIPLSNDPASAAASVLPQRGAVFGQLNDPAITQVAILVDHQWHIEPVSGAGYLVWLPVDGVPAKARFLSADDRVMWEVDLRARHRPIAPVAAGP